ncbi:neutral amino acid ABC transporter membrane protein [Halanaerobium saccharolyticum]|jgi:branched-chain amino acid transport system permease protein/neutral amino acid transport system permease protein|uniref:Neutral amino acid ABC transporter membrane protein n=1 Tax=Halanaerobium saccharolyticum TaxID=43595 RepID=A0A2T5RJS1_9FIRM|nr:MULTISPECIES: branched-chain amino acid ABC transporter permease [Halanaerobium]KXS48855.1 MAG: hydrophobic amino acid ABC transporter permease [Halanaerobium sp. T82-1]PTV98920.1 neutral amino acid ABC transporter membrane protein [Halanaerobium saccharolyticum]PUU89436.1 MAG: hydrophobic amino acid ABC transporter permease [Halanaerobium sp.]PUU93033.1 MAG: hydrophobic amino acid ABC transporter permease [Halanaerobium sp.]TDP89024.1 neutral amino acid ABC transporter membrane protein [Ha
MVLQLFLNGVILGSIIALGAIGLSLIYGILKFGHFAHGDLMTLGAYFAFLFKVQLGLPFWLAFVLAALLTAGTAILLNLILYRHLKKRDSVIVMISSVGAALIIRNLVLLFWGPQNQFYEKAIQMPIVLAGGLLRIKENQIIILVLALTLVIAVHLFLSKTKMGKAMRAMSDNIDLAQITGINTEKVIIWTWAMSGVLTAAAGILLAFDTHLTPVMGWNLLLPLFAAVILGGIGSPYGAMFGGLVIGISQEMSTLIISAAYKPAVAFTIMILMLIIRPSGLMGKKV